jgi:hypothetical protein
LARASRRIAPTRCDSLGSSRWFMWAGITSLEGWVAGWIVVAQRPEEQGRLLNKELLNSRVESTSLYPLYRKPLYRKPFALIFERAKTKEWSRREDLNLRIY